MLRHIGPIAGISYFCTQICISFLAVPAARFPLDFLSPAVLHLLSAVLSVAIQTDIFHFVLVLIVTSV